MKKKKPKQYTINELLKEVYSDKISNLIGSYKDNPFLKLTEIYIKQEEQRKEMQEKLKKFDDKLDKLLKED